MSSSTVVDVDQSKSTVLSNFTYPLSNVKNLEWSCASIAVVKVVQYPYFDRLNAVVVYCLLVVRLMTKIIGHPKIAFNQKPCHDVNSPFINGSRCTTLSYSYFARHSLIWGFPRLERQLVWIRMAIFH